MIAAMPNKENQPKEGCLTRGLRTSWPHFVLLLVYLAYLGIGGGIFLALEGGSPSDFSREVAEYEALKAQISGAVRNVTEGREVTVGNLTELWETYTALVNTPYLDKLTYLSRVDWTFTGSVLFCATSIATIGYGYLSPQTQLGRGLCILYALVGIPLNIIVMASAGKALARGSRSANGWLKRAFGRCAFWRKKVGPQTGGSIPPRTQSKGEGERSSRGRTHLRTLSYSSEFTDWGHRDLSSSTVEPARTHRDGEGDDGRSCTAPTDVDASADALHEEDSPAWVFVFLVLLYTCVFAVLMKLSQPTWTVLDGFYFIIITITTIGFGDLVTTRNDPDVNQLSYYFVGCLSIVIPVLGMILLSAGISIVISQFGKKTKEIKQVLCGSSKTQR